jgi:hypothetical protein
MMNICTQPFIHYDMKSKTNTNEKAKDKEVIEDQGQGQEGNFGSDGDLGTHRAVSGERAKQESENDKGKKKRK